MSNENYNVEVKEEKGNNDSIINKVFGRFFEN